MKIDLKRGLFVTQDQENTDYSELPKEKSRFSSWEGKKDFFAICSKLAPAFQANMKNHRSQKAGVFYAESLAFLAMCKLYKIDVILESGTGRGTSTEIWARNFDGKIITCEMDRKPHHVEVEQRLLKFGNVECCFGHSANIFLGKMESLKGRRIAFFIDGPKDLEAVFMAKYFFKNKDVVFVGIHDVANPVSKKRDDYGFMANFKNHTLSTDEKEFRDKFGYLDNDMSIWLYDETGKWLCESKEYTDHILKRFPKGPGIGIAINPLCEKFL